MYICVHELYTASQILDNMSYHRSAHAIVYKSMALTETILLFAEDHRYHQHSIIILVYCSLAFFARCYCCHSSFLHARYCSGVSIGRSLFLVLSFSLRLL